MIAVDAALAGKWLFSEEHSQAARKLLRDKLDAAEPIVAPTLLPIEVTNIIRQRMRREALTLTAGRRQLAHFLEIPVSLQAPDGLHRRALDFAERHGLPAVYDAHYVALAEMLGCELWTDDQRLLRMIGHAAPFVRAIAGYGAG